ncbi:MAG: biotin--[acetyl-CoA-carboxylase] ligase [Syntrophales bacterium]|nr:biotin--[acetyl-CoA-carboxylase] ligase [Syntrophales bacterium]
MFRRIHFYRELASTNTTAYELALAGAEEGVVVIADAQSQGRGRLNRAWHSPPGKNIYVSFILKPAMAAHQAPQLTLAAGVAVAEVVSQYCPGRVQIKWPNDIQVGGRKISGILSEVKAHASYVDFIILGIGINVNMDREDFPPELHHTATSLKMETKKDSCRLTLLSELFFAWDKWYETILKNGFKSIKDPFLSYAPIIGKMIQVTFRHEVLRGQVIDIDDQGTLWIKNERGEKVQITAGDMEFENT